MKCPYCGRAMQKGGIYGRQSLGIPWLPDDSRCPLIWSKKSVENLGGIMLSAPLYTFPKHIRVETYICHNCKIGIIFYDKKE